MAVEGEPFAAEDLFANARPWGGRLQVCRRRSRTRIRQPAGRPAGGGRARSAAHRVSRQRRFDGLTAWRVPTARLRVVRSADARARRRQAPRVRLPAHVARRLRHVSQHAARRSGLRVREVIRFRRAKARRLLGLLRAERAAQFVGERSEVFGSGASSACAGVLAKVGRFFGAPRPSSRGDRPSTGDTPMRFFAGSMLTISNAAVVPGGTVRASRPIGRPAQTSRHAPAPSTPGASSTNAPNSATRVTVPWTTCPTA